MARDFVINGETMVAVKGRTDSAIAGLTNLGLSVDQVVITPFFRQDEIRVEAWGDAPVDVQFQLASVNVSMTLVHFDPAVLDECVRLSMAGAPTEGTTNRAGQRLGNGLARFAPASANPGTGYQGGNNLIGLNLSSPVLNKPWRFLFSYLGAQPYMFPLGTRRSMVRLSWTAIPYTTDPYNGGLGAYGAVIWDHNTDA